MDARRRIILWASVALFIIYLLTLFSDGTLCVPHTALHRFRQDGLIFVLVLQIFVLLPKLRRDADGNEQAVDLISPGSMLILTFGVIGIAAAIELAVGATTVSNLMTPGIWWLFPALALAIGARRLWFHYSR